MPATGFMEIMAIVKGNPDTHSHLTALFQGLSGRASTKKVKPIWISLKQETVSGSGISSAICKSAPRSRQITTPGPHHSGQPGYRQQKWQTKKTRKSGILLLLVVLFVLNHRYRHYLGYNNITCATVFYRTQVCSMQ